MELRKFSHVLVLFVIIFSFVCELGCSLGTLRQASLIQLSSAPSSKSDEADSIKKAQPIEGGCGDVNEVNQETESGSAAGTPEDTVVEHTPCTSEGASDKIAKAQDMADAANSAGAK